MFSSVTSYFFGGSTESEQNDVDLQTKPAPEKDQDWILVDLPEKSPVPSIIHTPTCSDSESDNQRSSNNGSPCSQGSPVSRYCLHSKKGCYNENWIITPPPCFLAGGSNSSNVEMTPMENLLIEHPSMSVYNSRCSGSTGDASDLSESSNDDQSPSATRKILPRKVKTAMARQDPRKPNAVAARAGMVTQIQMVKSSQRSLKQSDSKKLSRHNLQRLNKSLNHQIGGGKPYNKSGRIHCPAGRSNTQMKH